jgi:hypothetical protein
MWALTPYEALVTGTVASRLKILHNNWKPTEKRIQLARKIGSRTAAGFEQKPSKTGRKKYFVKHTHFCKQF